MFSRRLEGSKGGTAFGSPEEYVAILMNQSTLRLAVRRKRVRECFSLCHRRSRNPSGCKA